MEPISCDLIFHINEEWFMDKFEKIIKRYVKNPEKIELTLMDLRKVLQEANEIQ